MSITTHSRHRNETMHSRCCTLQSMQWSYIAGVCKGDYGTMLHNARMLLVVATWCTWACKMICLEDECKWSRTRVCKWQWCHYKQCKSLTMMLNTSPWCWIQVNNVWRSAYEHYTNKRRQQGCCSTTEHYINRENASYKQRKSRGLWVLHS
jgi:hypothetical protein